MAAIGSRICCWYSRPASRFDDLQEGTERLLIAPEAHQLLPAPVSGVVDLRRRRRALRRGATPGGEEGGHAEQKEKRRAQRHRALKVVVWKMGA
jgi:hypothetical protein